MRKLMHGFRARAPTTSCTWHILLRSATSLPLRKVRVGTTLMPSAVRRKTSPSLPYDQNADDIDQAMIEV